MTKKNNSNKCEGDQCIMPGNNKDVKEKKNEKDTEKKKNTNKKEKR